jgi:GNAT superfamily N-acetyltransferase
MVSGRMIDSDAVLEYRRGGFVISTDRERLSLDVVHAFLTNCYWAKGIPREVVARSIEHSLCFGVYDESPPFGSAQGRLLAKEARPFGGAQGKRGAPVQVGFARVISDFATIAYVGDVFVLETHRGRGLGKWLMQCITEHPALQNLRRWILTTRDAHGLYSQFGFTPVKAPERFMELHRPNVYQTS